MKSALPVLVDTSVWIEYFRHGEGYACTELEKLLDLGIVCTTGVVIAELFSGVRTKKQNDTLDELLEPLPYLGTTRAIWRRAGEYRATLSRKGKPLPLPDILIAATSIHHNAELFTLDKHSSVLRKSLPLKLYG